MESESIQAKPDLQSAGIHLSTTDYTVILISIYTQITTAGFTFSIWGIIYTCQAIWIIYAWLVFCLQTCNTTGNLIRYLHNYFMDLQTFVLSHWVYIWLRSSCLCSDSSV